MSDTLRTRIAAVLAKHIDRQLTNYGNEREECGCGQQGNATYREHVADAVIRALGQRRCERCRSHKPVDQFPMPHKGSNQMRPFCIHLHRLHRMGHIVTDNLYRPAVQRILREHWPAMRRASATIAPGSRL